MSSSNKRFTQISASVDMKLGGPSSVVINTHNLFSENLKDYNLLIFGTSEIKKENIFKARTILDNRFGLIWNIFNPKFIKTLYKSDVILIHGYYLFSTIYSLVFYRGKNIFLMPHGTFEFYQQSKHALRKFIFSIILKAILNNRIIHFITASESEIAPIKAVFPQNKISSVGLGVNIPNIKYVRKNLTGQIQMVFIGRIAEKKRIDLCLHALKRLKSDGHNICLKVIGTGSAQLTQDLFDLVNKLDLNDHVKFLGHQGRTEINKELSNSDVFLLPSENENFAIAVAESIAATVPVIVSNYVSMHLFVDKYKVGITIKELNPDLISQAVLDIMKNHNHYRKNCEKYRDYLSWGVIFDAWINILGLKSTEGL